jgi:hypothetical protein
MNCGWDRLPRRALLFHNAEDWEQGNPDADGAAVSSSWRGHSGNLSATRSDSFPAIFTVSRWPIRTTGCAGFPVAPVV